ncbi:FXSXX-COOH protein [Streptomyces sp. DSM 44915]|uniref:FXSXX-COOH protein n=1 Tax=Streptomyces chisholmiae TaxID=3075540 RepID=A0ABU2JKZ0_9ACTN|nr:FXSXX-COOH protein [Streptomyces sp. DSM 44915]MDT0265646.1 FXSXX-COOH protein [Streptomyces sp. DSM 44915]
MSMVPEEAVAFEPLPELPDLLALSLAEVRRIDHPVLDAVLTDLRERVASPRETLWDFGQTMPGDGKEREK